MDKVNYFINHPEELKYELRKRRRGIIFWIIVFIIIFLLYIFVNRKRRSGYFQTLASATQLLSFIIIIIKVHQSKSVSGLSANTMICYCILLFARLTSTIPYNDYTPKNNYSHGFYQSIEIFSLLLCGYILFLIFFKYNETADTRIDSKVPFYYFAIPCFLLAIIFRSTKNDNFICDTNWAFSIYLETFAVFPQIFLFYQKKGKIESFTGHFVSLCGLSRIFSVIYWMNFYERLEAYDLPFELDEYSGYYVLGASILQLIIMADFYYLYFKSLLKGEQMNTSEI